MKDRLALVVALALGLAAIDLAVKALIVTPAVWMHHRSTDWMELSALLLVALLAMARLPSRFLAVGAGVLAGGVLGNLLSAVLHSGRIDNPFVVSYGADTIAFNAADVCALVGIVLVSSGLAGLVIHYRHLLPDAAVATRVYRRLRRGT